eukprot:TRINITY_DN877_c2_g1_i1.p1 TRINITY_DN877_c2_g1~~TRINITY_DN877_c2_g1_i1.p1  ORF type:complete len:201 (-),score=-16.42 TRINITY_DN877_c2_g1_i1:382-984(-)
MKLIDSFHIYRYIRNESIQYVYKYLYIFIRFVKVHMVSYIVSTIHLKLFMQEPVEFLDTTFSFWQFFIVFFVTSTIIMQSFLILFYHFFQFFYFNNADVNVKMVVLKILRGAFSIGFKLHAVVKIFFLLKQGKKKLCKQIFFQCFNHILFLVFLVLLSSVQMKKHKICFLVYLRIITNSCYVFFIFFKQNTLNQDCVAFL